MSSLGVLIDFCTIDKVRRVVNVSWMFVEQKYLAQPTTKLFQRHHTSELVLKKSELAARSGSAAETTQH